MSNYHFSRDLIVLPAVSTVNDGIMDPYGNENTASVPLVSDAGTPKQLYEQSVLDSLNLRRSQKAYISLECDTSLYFGFDLPATASVNSPGPGGVTTAEATRLYIDARLLDLGGVYHLCMDLDGNNAKMGMGDTGFVVYVTTMTTLKPWGILPAANQTVVMTCPGGCTDGVSAAYVGIYCNDTVNNGEMTVLAGERTPHGTFSKPSSLATDDYEVMIDAEGMISGKHYLFCTDLDGSNSHLPWGNTDLPMYISPISKSAYNAFYSSATSELRLTCDGRCTVDSRVYILDEQYLCDHLDFGGSKTGSADQTGSVATTPLGGSDGVVLAFVDTTALTAGLRFRICLDLDGVATAYAFGDIGIQVYMAAVTDSGGTISPATGQVITLTCATGCSTDTMAYLAITCDSTVTDGNIAANGVLNTAAVNIAGTSPSWTATIDASTLQPGRHYTLCTDLDGSTGTMAMGANDFQWYVTGVSGIPHYKFGLKQQKGIARSSQETVIFTCAQCTNSSSAYLGITCDSTNFAGYRATPSSSGLRSNMLPHRRVFRAGWGATFDTSTLTLGVNYQLCLDMDGAVEDLAFGYTGQTIYVSAVVSTPNVAVTQTFNTYLELTCESADACPDTAMIYLAISTSECATATSANIFNTPPTQTAAAVILGQVVHSVHICHTLSKT
ncbi:unnamed protein product [Cladocopium goreaui]|uniref:Subtilisin n=1 Tax=Cladocopium goreaui TaxID=2562237 RepID=A0A9P1CLR7_9DINO|nr:unnamed protein product [Cladocopium goreaui]